MDDLPDVSDGAGAGVGVAAAARRLSEWLTLAIIAVVSSD